MIFSKTKVVSKRKESFKFLSIAFKRNIQIYRKKIQEVFKIGRLSVDIVLFL